MLRRWTAASCAARAARARCSPDTMAFSEAVTMLRVDAHAEQRRRVADAQLEVGHRRRRRRCRSRARGSRARASAAPVARCSAVDEGVDRPVAAAVDGCSRAVARRSVGAAARRAPSALSADATWCATRMRRPRPYSRSKMRHRSAAVSSLPVSSITACTTWLNSICSRRGSSSAVLALEQVGDAALARLAVDADHRVVAAARGPSGRSAGRACPRCRRPGARRRPS